MNRTFIIILFSVLLCTCQEYYTDPEITTGSEYLVIEGTITNEPGPYVVRVSETTPYNRSVGQTQDTLQVTGAFVIISDNTATADTCRELEPGKYYTSRIRGETGKTYRLDIRMPDGKAYQSEPCTMSDPAGFDSIYAETGERTVLESSTSGGYFERTQTGVYLYLDAAPRGEEYYYKIETTVVKEATHQEWRNGRSAPSGSRPPQPTPVYCWEISALQNDRSLVSSITGSSDIIRKRPSGFIDSDVYSLEDAIRDPSYLTGVFATTTIYAVPKRIFEIYTQLNKQSNPENSIFDPIPTRIETNITCTNDPGRIVLGYFSASAVSRKVRFFRWRDNHVDSRNVDPDYALPATEGCESDVPPDFWIRP